MRKSDNLCRAFVCLGLNKCSPLVLDKCVGDSGGSARDYLGGC